MFPDFTKPFLLDTDASNTGISGVLSQLDDEGKEHVIAFASRTLCDPSRVVGRSRVHGAISPLFAGQGVYSPDRSWFAVVAVVQRSRRTVGQVAGETAGVPP